MPHKFNILLILAISVSCYGLFVQNCLADTSEEDTNDSKITSESESELEADFFDFDLPFMDTDLPPPELIYEDEEDSTQSEQTDSSFFSLLDEHQQTFSSYLQKYVQGIDNFFADETSVSEKTGSFLRLRFETLWPEGAGVSTKGKISLKLRLPKTQRKVKLVITSDLDEQKSTLERETNETPARTEDERGLYTGLERVREGKKWKLKPSIGVKIRSPVVWYAKYKAERQIELNEWLMGFYQKFYWFDDSGFGSDTSLRWDRKVIDNLLFRSDSFMRYTDETDYFDVSQTFSLIQTLSPRRAITYKIGALGIFDDETTYATTYLVSAQYRGNIHKDYIFLDIQPQILFDRGNEFKGSTELFIRLEFFYRG